MTKNITFQNALLFPSVFDNLMANNTNVELNKTDTSLFLMKNLERDIQHLLNSRKMFLTWSKKLTELNLSVLNYGLDSNILNQHFDSEARKLQLCEHIQEVLSLHETRLTNIKVSILNTPEEPMKNFRFSIVANSRINILNNTIIFQSIFYQHSQQFNVMVE